MRSFWPGHQIHDSVIQHVTMTQRVSPLRITVFTHHPVSSMTVIQMDPIEVTHKSADFLRHVPLASHLYFDIIRQLWSRATQGKQKMTTFRNKRLTYFMIYIL